MNRVAFDLGEISMHSVEERLTKLEQVVFGNIASVDRKKDWRRTIGMFDGDPVMKEIIDEALQLRADERAQTRRANGSAP